MRSLLALVLLVVASCGDGTALPVPDAAPDAGTPADASPDACPNVILLRAGFLGPYECRDGQDR